MEQIRLAWLAVPKNLLLFDCVGALVTSLSTGLLLTTVLPTGLPIWTLVSFSIAAAGFACFGFISYINWADEVWPLAVVGTLNLLYCFTAISTAWILLPRVTTIGMIYIAVECAIVIPLGVYELVVARYRRSRTK